MTRHVIATVRGMISQWEGVRLRAYRDGGGVPTIGVGHTAGVHMGQRITAAEADAFLTADLAIAEHAVESMVRVPLNDLQFGVLVSFVFNLGTTAFAKSTMLRKLNAGRYQAVPKELMKWVHDNGKLVPGLVNRRTKEAALWNSATMYVRPDLVQERRS